MSAEVRVDILWGVLGQTLTVHRPVRVVADHASGRVCGLPPGHLICRGEEKGMLGKVRRGGDGWEDDEDEGG